MATYYVRKTGSDAAAGTSAGAAWLTIGKALGASGIASGDTVYIGAGTYREAMTVAMTSAVAETFVIADVDGANTGDAGEVVWTAYTTNDTTTPSTNPNLDLAGRDFLTFIGFTFVSGNVSGGGAVKATTTNSVNIKFTDCTFIAGAATNRFITYTGLADVAANWTIDRCRFYGPGGGVCILPVFPTSASADYDTNFVVKNCKFDGVAVGVRADTTGAGAFKAGGVQIWNCTIQSSGNCFFTNSANLSTSIPCVIYNCILISNGTALSANTSGQITENYNYIFAATARSNVTAGGNSQTSPTYAPLLTVGQEDYLGKFRRPFLTPMSGSPLLGFGNQASGPTVDILNRPRAAGGGSNSYGLGALERHDTAAKEGTTVDAGSAINIVCPGDQYIQIPVDATSTTITIKYRSDAGVIPTAQVLANGEIGVSASAVQTGSAAQGTYTTLTIPAFTPTAKGFVTLMLACTGTAGNLAYFDTVTGGASGSQGLDYFRRGDVFIAAVQSAAGGGTTIAGTTMLRGMVA